MREYSAQKNYHEKQTISYLFFIWRTHLYSVFFVIPSFIGFYYSFTDWNRYTSELNFVGFDNFRTILLFQY